MYKLKKKKILTFFTVYHVQKTNFIISIIKFPLSSRYYSLELWFIMNHGSNCNRFQDIIISLVKSLKNIH